MLADTLNKTRVKTHTQAEHLARLMESMVGANEWGQVANHHILFN